MRKALVNLLAIQIFVILAVAAGFYVYDREPAAVAAALYGGAVAVGASLLLAWRMSRAGRARGALNLGGLVLGLLERIVFIVAALIVGFAVL
ncbi:MAG TPA: hypothetical protein VFX38_04995, partial [Gammaproteobacteria bacterium]|nr:hypothetical protein [Gammaproteobacteria bacterium]